MFACSSVSTLLATWPFYPSLSHKKDGQPFFWALVLFGLCLVGFGISIWPDVIPAGGTICEVVAPHRSQLSMLVGASVRIPVIRSIQGISLMAVGQGKNARERG